MQLEQILIVDSLPSGRETIEWALERAGVAAETFASLEGWSPGERPSQVAIVSLRTTDLQELGAIKRLSQDAGKRYAPVLALGPDSARDKAAEAGAALFLSTPAYVRDAVNAARIMAAADGDVNGAEFEVRARLAVFDGLYQLVRTLLSLQRSFIVELRAGRHRGELRFVSGMLSAAHLNNLQGSTALHRMLLWDDGDLVIRARSQVRRSGQFAANPESMILEADRFLRDFTHEAGDLGTARTVYQQDLTRVAQRAVNVPEEVSPVFRLFDGQRDLAAVVQDSPFPVFDTIRIIRRLAQAGALVPKRSQDAVAFARPRDETSGVMAIAGWNEKDKRERTPSPLLEPRRKRKITASRLVAQRPSTLDEGPITPPPSSMAPGPVSGELPPRTSSPSMPAQPPVAHLLVPKAPTTLQAPKTAPPLRLEPSPHSHTHTPTPALRPYDLRPQGLKPTDAAKPESAVKTAPGPFAPPPLAAAGPARPLSARPTPVATPSLSSRRPTTLPPTGPAPVVPPFPQAKPAVTGGPPPPPAAAPPPFAAAVPIPAEPRARTSETISTVAGEIGSRPPRPRPPVPPPEPRNDSRVEGRSAEIRSGEIRAPIPLVPTSAKPTAGAPFRPPSVVIDASQMSAPVSLEESAPAPVSMAEAKAPSPGNQSQTTRAPERSKEKEAKSAEGGSTPPAAAPGTPRPLTPGPSGSSRRRGQGSGNAFDDVESDFFAREADLYRHHVVEDFGDLDDKPGSGIHRGPTRRKP